MNKAKLDINISRIGSFIDRHIASVPFLPGGLPPFASIEFSNNGLCNKRCVFCPRVNATLFPNKEEHLSFGLFKKIIKELAMIDYSGRISFSGFCEPLMSKDLERCISWGKKICPRMTIEISSNGDFASKSRLRSLFSAGLDNIRISLYDGPGQDKQSLNKKRQLNLSDKQFILRRRYLSPAQNYGLTISNRAGAIFLQNEYLTLKPLAEPLRQACYYPFYKMLVDYNGDVLICSNDWLKKLIVGNLKKQTVFEVWNSELFNNARKALINNNRESSPCNLCDVNGLYNGQRHFAAWLAYYQAKAKRKD